MGTAPRATPGEILRRWAPSVFVAGVAVLLAAPRLRDGQIAAALGPGLAMLLVAVLVSPAIYPADRHVDAPVTVFWKPGCSFCVLLRLGVLGVGRRARWVDVSLDEAGAARVRDANGGDLTTPTVVTPNATWTNPSPGRVRALLAR